MKHELVKDYFEVYKIREMRIEDILEYLETEDNHPTFVLPLIYTLFKNYNKENLYRNKYFKLLFDNKKLISKEEYFSEISTNREQGERLPNEIFNLFDKNEAIRYVFNELIDNVYRHSNFDFGLIYCRNYNDFAEFAIFDNGNSIPGTFRLAGLDIGDDSTIIIKALSGLSSKEDIGTGLNSSYKIITGGFKGQFLISSAKGVVSFTDYKKEIIYKGQYLHGTLVSFTVPTPIKKFSIYDGFISKGEFIHYL
ncbi:MAG: hypothetical protein OH338_02905 [Candidatus Parvarchaeota archaeon]|nr:hypothetical protein [Candidatus Parvarchaeota archaeon]MCW1294866.1 hypothetical protein [Candidatus Parvarchaeum tengchongense]MCW1295848.1 hypothetical protein [Candidatus Parvarchaeum tengchongense]MCW1299654.1 hypothetical protein [Candidatus Parvarchaeum tengchongense]MCW1312353.1 hypothetical protein [Candidatus Parvarchaeum tengchongense]